MSEIENFDLVVIGGGPAGYTGSIRAAQLGLKVAIVEKEKTLGGTCLNVGCIPSKAILESSEHFAMASHGDFATHGLKFSKVELDLPAMMARKDKIVKDLTSGVAFLMKKNKISHFEGTGSLSGPNAIEIKKSDGSKVQISAKNIMLATGSSVIELPFAKFDGKRIISSTEALSLEAVPKHLIVIGGGVIGLELGSVWARLGAKVTVIEYSSHICGGSDQGTAKLLQRSLTKQGFEFIMAAKVTDVKASNKGVLVTYESLAEQKTQAIEGDVCLVAVGRKPYSEGLGLEALGIEKDDRGRVKVDHHLRTKYSHIYAVGDLIVGPMLAHKAEEEGVAVAEMIVTGHGHVNYDTVPGVIYTWPELASVGLTEEQLKEKSIPYKAGVFPFAANGRAKALGMVDGQVKILAHAESDKVLGVHIVGPRASDMIAEAVVAMEFGASSEDIARSFHAHPTLAEVMREAALAVDKRARQS
jgi:dihydrolipoamide dehydrogenase